MDYRITHSSASCCLRTFQKNRRKNGSKIKAYELMLKWSSDLGHFNFNWEWRLWEFRFFTKKTHTQVTKTDHPKSEATSDGLCFYFVYKLLKVL